MISVSFLFLFAVCIINTDASMISASKEVKKLLCQDYGNATQFVKFKIVNNWNKAIRGAVIYNYEAPEDVLKGFKARHTFQAKMDPMPKDANMNAHCYAKVVIQEEGALINPGAIVCGNSISEELKVAAHYMEIHKESRELVCVTNY